MIFNEAELNILHLYTYCALKTRAWVEFKGSLHTWNTAGQIYLGCKKKNILLMHFGVMSINNYLLYVYIFVKVLNNMSSVHLSEY